MHIILSLLLALAPTTIDIPPEVPSGGIDQPATASAPAERLDPPEAVPETTVAPVFASDCDEMSYYRAAVGLPARFDRIGWRESNCRLETGVRTSCCVGWWQLSVSLHLRDPRLTDRYHACGVYSYRDADGPGDQRRHACATKALFDVVGYSAWAATS